MKNRRNAPALRHEGQRWLCYAFVLLALLPLFLPVRARADIGPKPSVQISFRQLGLLGLEDNRYYGTLLSKDGQSMGPYQTKEETQGEENTWVWWGYEDQEEMDREIPPEVTEAFLSYRDPEGFQLLNWCCDCTETGELVWNYWPPESYKLLLYFPKEDIFCVSPAYEKYAYDSYYTASLARYDSGTVTLERNYPYGDELASLVVRVVLTLVVEMGLALLFGYRGKRLLGFIALVNFITQLGLNAALNGMDYTVGIAPGGFQIFNFYLLELAVLVVEAVLYGKLLPRFSKASESRSKAVTYAVLANVLSCFLGIRLADWLPGLF